MSKIEESSPRSFSPDDEVDYKSMSLIAVVSLGLGIASVFSLLHTALWILPALAVVVGLIARHRIKKNQQSTSGSGLAMAGIVLGLFFASCAVSGYFLHRYLIRNMAREYCDQWLELVKEVQLYDAYELTHFFEARRPPNANLMSLYGPIPDVTKKPEGPIGVQNEFKKYWTSSPQKELILFGKQPSSKTRFEKFGLVVHEFVAHFQYKKDTVELYYSYDYVENGEPRTIQFVVLMSRRWTAVEQQHWWVETITTVSRSDSESA